MFLGVGVLSLIPSILILYVIMSKRQLHNACNKMIGQLTMVDAGYSLFIITWFPTKIYLGIERCQMEGTVMFACNVGWMYSAMMVAILRYRVSLDNVPLASFKGKELIRIQSFSVLVSCLLGGLIGLHGKFRIMPSQAYCYLLYSRNDPTIAHIYSAVLLLMSIPTVTAVCLYWAIYENYRFLLSIRLDKHKENHYILAWKSVSYASLFFFTFLPYGCGMLAEMVASNTRQPILDTMLVTCVLIHKLASPILTLALHDPISREVKHLLFGPSN
ncbi:hypothetical protein DSO57_1018729 [Entomophthora muscae]|uniref:Uncharacterized protein n=2 Tax=Entomophthora muscae TaxID=34485 RepID=A0ACC2RJ01_9FUNG|nr:hypothetical protein DSO57_1035584 [Entomophthora muscae]KAJ9050001.1 hypothetical protein DSO57_1018729 [Entomophthora muscae]